MATTSYFRWRGDDEAADHVKKENMTEFYEEVGLLKEKQFLRMRRETKDEEETRSGGELAKRSPQSNRGNRGAVRRLMGIIIPEGEGR